ncbi:hypothetical protein DYB25_011039, partial [Aphanomyces astaci]
MSKLEWSERSGLETFTDQFQEFTRKLTAAGDTTPDSAHINRFLCLLPPRFANSVMYITRERRNSNAYQTLPSILAELKLDDERQKMHDPSLARKASRTDDALMTTGNFTAARLDTLPQNAAANKATSREEPSAGAEATEVRGGGNGGRGGRPNWHEQGNYANEDEKDYNKDVFTVELIEHADVYRAVDAPGTDDDDDFAVFGCVCFRRIEVPHKTSARANKCLFLGYNETKKAYKVYDLEEKKIVFTLDCRFEETEFLQLRLNLQDEQGEPANNQGTTNTNGQPFEEVDREPSPAASETNLLWAQEHKHAQTTRPRRPANATNSKAHATTLHDPSTARDRPPTPRSDVSSRRTPKSHTPMMRETANDTVSNARRSARLEEVAQRLKAAAARTTKTLLDERSPLHPVRSSARPYNVDMPFMEAPPKTTRTEDGERGVATQEFDKTRDDGANMTYDVCFNVANADVDED